MLHYKRIGAVLLSIAMTASLCACAGSSTSQSTSSDSQASTTASSTENLTEDTVTNPDNISDLAFKSNAWNYDADNNVYWQIGVVYCADAQATDYESMGIYVPGDYMKATANGDGTYTCTIDTGKTVGGYTAATAPIVMPVNTAGYAAQAAPTSYSYSGLSDYLSAGFVYVYAGCRGRNNGTNSDGSSYSGGAPWGVTDLKSAVRYLRYNTASLPGDKDRIFTFGHSGGGAQSSLMGASGDSDLYYSYLENIGSAMRDGSGNYISDAICGAMCWCPITSLDVADEAYEWMMGQYSTSGTRADTAWTSALSDDMAASFADYINAAGFKDSSGNTLTLSKSDSGIYASGTYYDYMKSVIETSLNNFLSDTTFPYTSGSTTMADGGCAGGGSGQSDMASGSAPSGGAPSGMTSGSAPTGDTSGSGMPSGMTRGAGGMGASSGTSAASATYDTVQDYIDSLNSDTTWIQYDAYTNTATITSVEAFVQHCKNATKDVGAFDSLNESQAENMVFGNAESDALHFDATMAALLSSNAANYSTFNDYDSSYAAAYAGDMNNTDALGTLTAVRQNMYNPLYYISDYYAGAGSAKTASYWRINTGIDQGDTSLTTEMNLALALEQNSGVKSVDFTTVWGLGHTTAERTGTSSVNFISWVNDCLK